jgi:hypothetical protein
MAKRTWNIMGKYQGKTEKIDSQSSESAANRLASEYRMAFGSSWEIWVE